MAAQMIEQAKRALWWLWDFSGLRAIWKKAFPDRDCKRFGSPPRTFVLWAFGIYAALFGLATARYESALDRIENRTAGIYAQLGSKAWMEAIERIPAAQRMKRPRQPEVVSVISVFRSIFGAQVYDVDNQRSLADAVVSRKGGLDGLDLRGAFLSHGDLMRPHRIRSPLPPDVTLSDLDNMRIDSLAGTIAEPEYSIVRDSLDFSSAHAPGADFRDVDFRGVNFDSANLSGARFEGADVRYVEFRDAILGGSMFAGARVDGAHFHGAKGLTCDQLQSASGWKSSYRDIALACGESIPQFDRSRITPGQS